jgi:hypothetical protein
VTDPSSGPGRWAELPDWLHPLAELAGCVRGDELAPRFPHPPSDARPPSVHNSAAVVR